MNEQNQNQHEMRPAINQLIDRERIRGASRMIPEGTEASSVTEEQIAAVIQDVDTFCRQHNITRKDLSAATAYSHAVISEFLGSKYNGDRAKVAINLEQWLTEEENRRSRPKTTQFVWTNVALQIKSVASYCLDKKRIGLVYGPDTSGIGKTTSLLAIHQLLGTRRSTLVTMDEVDCNRTGVLTKLCTALHVTDKGSNKQRFTRIVETLRGRSHILLIDQIHNLRGGKEDAPLYILADIYDATKSAQLWCGTTDMVAYLERQRKKVGDASLAQIRRRVYPAIDLMDMLKHGGDDGKGQPLATVEQVAQMFAKNKLRLSTAAIRFMAMLINHADSGGIGLCENLVEYATDLALVSGKVTSLGVEHLKAAMRHGITIPRAEAILREIDDEDGGRISKVG